MDVVPRAWTHLIGEVVHSPVPARAEVPAAFGEYVRELLGVPAPSRMTDGGREPWGAPFERSHDPDNPLDRVIMATRQAVFPHWGLVADPFGGF